MEPAELFVLRERVPDPLHPHHQIPQHYSLAKGSGQLQRERKVAPSSLHMPVPEGNHRAPSISPGKMTFLVSGSLILQSSHFPLEKHF